LQKEPHDQPLSFVSAASRKRGKSADLKLYVFFRLHLLQPLHFQHLLPFCSNRGSWPHAWPGAFSNRRFYHIFPSPLTLRLELPEFGVRNLTGDLAEPEVGRFTARARQRLESDHVLGQDIHLTGYARAYSEQFHRKRDVGICLKQQLAVRIVVGPQLPIALVTPELDDFADALKGQVERRLSKLLNEFARVRFVW